MIPRGSHFNGLIKGVQAVNQPVSGGSPPFNGGPGDAGTAERVQTATAARSKLEVVVVQIGPEEAGKRSREKMLE